MRSLAFVLLLVSLPALAGDWPHPRGPRFDGTAPGERIPEGKRLAVRWKIPLGSAYSGIAVADGRVVSLFADGDADWVAAFAAADGSEIWRRRLGPRTEGHDGSDDGPVAGPSIGAGRVYVLTPTGALSATSLADGGSMWEVSLADLGGEAPFFGFTTTPLFHAGTLFVQVGGTEGRSLVAFDAATGKRRWSVDGGKVEYQSPVLAELGGKTQLVTVDAAAIAAHGLDGTPLWSIPLGEERVSSSQPTVFGEHLLVAMGGGATVFRVGSAGAEEAYRTEHLGRTYAPPVYHAGHLYGFRGQVLTCVDAATGERVWRSRPPGGDGLLLADGHLVVFGAKGVVAVARATPEGYEEVSSVQALPGSSLTWPSYSDGVIYVRNLEELAAVEWSEGDGRAAADDATRGTSFARMLARAEESDSPGKVVDEFLSRQASVPVVEGDHVHFLFRGEAEQVGVSGTMNDSRAVEPLERLPGTDLFHRTYALEPGGRWEYIYHVDFDDTVVDPLNPRVVPWQDGERSELVTPGYRFAEPERGPRAAGTLEELTLESEILGYEKPITVWLPPGYAAGEEAYPVLVINDGKDWREHARLVEALEHTPGLELPIVAFVEAHGRWWLEAGGSRTADYVEMLAKELLPELSRRFRVSRGRGSHAIWGSAYFGVPALDAALRHPGLFGKVALQSVGLGLGGEQALWKLLDRKRAGKHLAVVYLDWNRWDERNIDRGIDLGRSSEELASRLEQAGIAFSGGERHDSQGWGAARNRAPVVLRALFGN